MNVDFREHQRLAELALKAKRGTIDAKSLGQRARILYGYLTERELEELAFTGGGA